MKNLLKPVNRHVPMTGVEKSEIMDCLKSGKSRSQRKPEDLHQAQIRFEEATELLKSFGKQMESKNHKSK